MNVVGGTIGVGSTTVNVQTSTIQNPLPVSLSSAVPTSTVIIVGTTTSPVPVTLLSTTVSAVQSGGWNIGINPASNTVAAAQAGAWSITVANNPATTAATSAVSSTVAAVTLLNTNTSRKGASIFNDGGTDLFVRFGTQASATSYKVKVLSQSYFEFPLPVYTGIVSGYWTTTGGTAFMSEES